jgi:hypothetical protein
VLSVAVCEKRKYLKRFVTGACWFWMIVAACSAAQDQNQDMAGMHHEHHPGMDASMPAMDMSTDLPSPHAGSGTSWEPASVPAHMWMTSPAGWDIMAHGALSVSYNQQGGPRGVGKAESVNWIMFMEQHRFAGGSLMFRQMFSAEALTAPPPGFPELFQTGETYHGMPLVDHQHPHNVFAELAVYYSHPLTERTSWFVYGGPSAEPALGPVAFNHRASVAELPAAPLSHHLQDSTHTSFGVVTGGVIIKRLKLEGSAFNGREPNEHRWSIQLNPLDSWSGRASIAPNRNWTAQYSYGHLVDPEAAEPGNEDRQTASIEYSRPLAAGSWSSALIWGRKHKDSNGHNLNSYVLESTVNFRRRNYAYTRMELVDKDELFPENPASPSYRIGAYTFGGVRDLARSHLWQFGLGADVTFYSKPASLDSSYGQNPVSFKVFLRVRPGLSEHMHH